MQDGRPDEDHPTSPVRYQDTGVPKYEYTYILITMTPTTVAVVNLKGGVGKTTTAVHLAAAAFHSGEAALLIDLDPQASATDHLVEEAPDAANAGRWLVGACSLGEAIIEARPAGRRARFDLAPSGGMAMSEAEVRLTARGSKKTFGRLLRAAPEAERYDVIVLDTGPGLNHLLLNALYAADLVICPVELQMAAIQGLRRLRDTLEFVAEEDGVEPRVLLLPTNADGRVRESAELLAVLQREFGKVPQGQVLTPIRYSSSLSRAYGARLTIYELDPRDRAAEDYANVFRQIRQPNGSQAS